MGVSIACTEYESSLDRGPVAPEPSSGGVRGPGRGNVPALSAPRAPIAPLGSEDAPDAALPNGAADGARADAGGDAAVEAPLAPDPPDAAAADCLEGSVVAGRCHRASASALTWSDARADCLAWGGDLVSIESAEEDAAVASLLEVSVWTGASDQTADGVFTWADGSPIVFGNWGNGQPDAFPGPDCVEKRQETGEAWYDQPCTSANAYVCERALTP